MVQALRFNIQPLHFASAGSLERRDRHKVSYAWDLGWNNTLRERILLNKRKDTFMIWKVKKSKLSGTITVPPSKSHTIRALVTATLSEGTSTIEGALLEGDGKSVLEAVSGLGAHYSLSSETLVLTGTGKNFTEDPGTLFLGNSGTGARMIASVAALGGSPCTVDGDDSLRTRPMRPLLQSLADLGASYTIHQRDRDIPFTVRGPITGGETTVSGVTSQFLSSLLLAAPLAENDSVIHVEDLHERPYVELTLWWLDKTGIRYSVSDDFSTFIVPGGQNYAPVNQRIPGDFSSATFGAVAAALTGGMVTLGNIDFSDPQGDKELFAILETMGVAVDRGGLHAAVHGSGAVRGAEIDLNAMPDALPALAVLGCVAESTTSLVNVKQARIKETDRIAVMAEELGKMGAAVEEKEDALIIRRSKLTGCRVNGRHDHRVVMALALAGMVADGETIIETAEAAAVTYPAFVEDFRSLGASIEVSGQ